MEKLKNREIEKHRNVEKLKHQTSRKIPRNPNRGIGKCRNGKYRKSKTRIENLGNRKVKKWQSLNTRMQKFKGRNFEKSKIDKSKSRKIENSSIENPEESINRKVK